MPSASNVAVDVAVSEHALDRNDSLLSGYVSGFVINELGWTPEPIRYDLLVGRLVVGQCDLPPLCVGHPDQAAAGVVLVARCAVATRIADLDQTMLPVVSETGDTAHRVGVCHQIAIAVVGIGLDVSEQIRNRDDAAPRVAREDDAYSV